MTLLTVWADDRPETPLVQTADRAAIAEHLGALGVTYELLDAQAAAGGAPALAATATSDEVLAAHRSLVDALVAEHGYTLVDVAQIHPRDDDEWRTMAATARGKFLAEHTHDEEEIRYFAHGSGVFYLHIGDRVAAVLCTAGDLINVPALTTHWFDMGTSPDFTAIRFFRTDDGWVGSFTGSDIATRFADADTLQAQARAHA